MISKTTRRVFSAWIAAFGAATISVATYSAQAAEFRLIEDNTNPGVPIIYMSGEIAAGDREKLLSLLSSKAKNAVMATDFWLNSPGGNLREAMRIGAVVEELGYVAIVPIGATCASACFFIWTSASGRLAPGDVVIHRPYFDMRQSPQSATRFEEHYRAAGEDARRYLAQRNVPADLIELMLSFSSVEGHVLSERDKRRIGPMSTARMEYMIQNCGFPSARKAGQIVAEGGFSSEEQKAMRECGLNYYKTQRNEFFSKLLSGKP